MKVREPINCCCIMVRLIDVAECVGYKFYCLHIYLALGMMTLLCEIQQYVVGSKLVRVCCPVLGFEEFLFPRVACSLSLSTSCILYLYVIT